MTRYARALAAGLQAVILLALSGLAGDEPRPPHMWKDRYQYNFRWASPSGVDLTSEIAIQVRSYVETAFLNGAGQTDWREIWKRMGVSENQLSSPLSLQFDERASDPRWTIRGTAYASLAAVERQDIPPPYDRRTPPNRWYLTATVCVWGTGLAYGDRSGEYYSGRYAALRSGRLELIFSLPGGGVADPGARISGPARYPTRNYFGDWLQSSRVVTPDLGRGTGNPETCQLPPEFPDTLAPGEYVEKPSVRVPPPEILPPYPGWPA